MNRKERIQKYLKDCILKGKIEIRPTIPPFSSKLEEELSKNINEILDDLIKKGTLNED